MPRTLLRLALIALLCAAGLCDAEAATDALPPGAAPTAANLPPDPRREAKRQASERVTLTEQEKLLIKRPDRQRPEHPLSVPVFGRPLTFGGRYTARTRYDGNKLLDFDLFKTDEDDVDGDGNTDELEDDAADKARSDDQLRFNQALQLDVFYPFTENISAYFEAKLSWRNLVWADHAPTNDEWLFERGEAWLYLGNLFGSPFSLQPGRQRIWDEREWWWDAELDAVRLRFDREQFHAEISVAEELLPVQFDESDIDPEDEDVLQILGSANWAWAEKQQLGIYALHRHDHSSRQKLATPPLPCVASEDFPPGFPDEAKAFFRRGCVSFEDESDVDMTWFGVSAHGRLKLGRPGKVYYWLDAAGVVGKETFTDYAGPNNARRVGSVNRGTVSGGGIDVGATWEAPLPGRPNFTLGYAFGSGKSGMEEESDLGFRQTGLQDNSDKFRGVANFRYYGELLDPELSNLHIATAGFGFRFLRRSSVDFVYHHYRQAEPAPFLRDVSFKRDPDGVHRAIGQEWDVIVGFEESSVFEIKLVGALFRAGKAFAPDTGELSYLASLRLRLNF